MRRFSERCIRWSLALVQLVEDHLFLLKIRELVFASATQLRKVHLFAHYAGLIQDSSVSLVRKRRAIIFDYDVQHCVISIGFHKPVHF